MSDATAERVERNYCPTIVAMMKAGKHYLLAAENAVRRDLNTYEGGGNSKLAKATPREMADVITALLILLDDARKEPASSRQAGRWIPPQVKSALEFYGNSDNYRFGPNGSYDDLDTMMEIDRGRAARAALAALPRQSAPVSSADLDAGEGKA